MTEQCYTSQAIQSVSCALKAGFHMRSAIRDHMETSLKKNLKALSSVERLRIFGLKRKFLLIFWSQPNQQEKYRKILTMF